MVSRLGKTSNKVYPVLRTTPSKKNGALNRVRKYLRNSLKKNGIGNFKHVMLSIFKKKYCKEIKVNLNGDVLFLFKIK